MWMDAVEGIICSGHVEMRGDADTRKILPDVIPATQEDFGKEYLDYIISIKTVKSLDEAIEHINQYNTGHSETIITENQEHGLHIKK